MNKLEKDFTTYAQYLQTYATRLSTISKSIDEILDTKMIVPERKLQTALDGVYSDSRSEEDEIKYGIEEWYKKTHGVSTLSDVTALSLLSENAEPSYVEQNVLYNLRKIKKIADAFSDYSVLGNDIKFAKIPPTLTELFVGVTKKLAETYLEQLRIISSRINRAQEYKILSMDWLTDVFDGDEYKAARVMENVLVITKMAYPDPEHPPIPDHFLSDTDFSVDLTIKSDYV